MEQKHYKLRYLPLFVSDMEEIVDYITLQNPDAAYHFLERVEAAIWKRLEFPVSFEPYQGTGARKHPYYRIYVGNFIIYYVVIDDVMEVRRILWDKRDAGWLLEWD